MSIFEGNYRPDDRSNFEAMAINGPFHLSVQGGETAYSSPRESFINLDEYDAFEVAILEDNSINDYGFTFVDVKDTFPDIYNYLYPYQESGNATIFAYVPRDVVEKVFDLFIYS